MFLKEHRLSIIIDNSEGEQRGNPPFTPHPPSNLFHLRMVLQVTEIQKGK
jgi:hypothetical protein